MKMVHFDVIGYLNPMKYALGKKHLRLSGKRGKTQMRFFRKITHHCQNCVNGNNEKGKWKKTFLRRSLYVNPKKTLRRKKYWHVFCEKKKKYYPWDSYKHCFKINTFLKKQEEYKLRTETVSKPSEPLIKCSLCKNEWKILKYKRCPVCFPKDCEKAQREDEWECPFCKKGVIVGYTVHMGCLDELREDLQKWCKEFQKIGHPYWEEIEKYLEERAK